MRSVLHPTRLIATLVLLAVPLLQSAAQGRYAEIAAREGRAHVYHEAIVLPGKAAPQTVITFRIPNSFLVFMQEGDGFAAHPEVTVELYRDGERIDEAIWRGDQHASSFEDTRSESEDVEGSVRFDIVPGSYAYRIQLSEARAGVLGHGLARPFEVTDFTDSGIGSLFFVAGADLDTAEAALDPINLSGSAPFGESAELAVPVRVDGKNAVIEYRIYQRGGPSAVAELEGRASRDGAFDIRASESRKSKEREIELSADDQLVREGTVSLDEATSIGELRPDCFCWSLEGAALGRMALIDLDTETLENGTYVLDLSVSSSEKSLKQRSVFRTHWRNMPASLYDVGVAIRNLSFIESRDKIRSMLKGSREDQVEAFRAYWKQRDPSPGTIVNELMEEYYERIDYAASEFRTGKTPLPDGLRTDAARIYVVHGPPDDVSSTFPSSGGVQQVWRYPDGRRFVFWASSSLEPLTLEETSITTGGSDGDGS